MTIQSFSRQPLTVIRHPQSHRKVGLLGGSFNPAHAGHIHISLAAKRALGVEEIWWMVSPHNPLKKKADLADYAERVAYAKKLTAPHRFIKVTGIEANLGTRYTVDTLKALKKHMPNTEFIWLMGADNLKTFHLWKGWEQIMQLMPVLVLDRAPYSHAALKSKAALRFAHQRVCNAGQLSEPGRVLPAWGYLHMRLHPASATDIRKRIACA